MIKCEKCMHAYTHNDFDGAVSLLTLFWAYPEDTITYKPVNNLQIDSISKSVQEVSRPCTTFVLDLALRKEFYPALNEPNIVFIDHHETSESFIPKFDKAKVLHKTTTSNALWMAQIFKGEKYPVRTRDQKYLIALADDFDCYRLDIPESYDLNLLFWAGYRNNFAQFIKDYSQGYREMTKEQKKIVSLVKEEAESTVDKIQLFEGSVLIEGKVCRVLSFMQERFATTVMDLLMKRYAPDLLVFINPKSEKVCVRQNNKHPDPIHVGNLTEKYCEGGGHRHAGGGKITPMLMEWTKNFKPFKG